MRHCVYSRDDDIRERSFHGKVKEFDSYLDQIKDPGLGHLRASQGSWTVGEAETEAAIEGRAKRLRDTRHVTYRSATHSRTWNTYAFQASPRVRPRSRHRAHPDMGSKRPMAVGDSTSVPPPTKRTKVIIAPFPILSSRFLFPREHAHFFTDRLTEFVRRHMDNRESRVTYLRRMKPSRPSPEALIPACRS